MYINIYVIYIYINIFIYVYIYMYVFINMKAYWLSAPRHLRKSESAKQVGILPAMKSFYTKSQSGGIFTSCVFCVVPHWM